MPEEQRGSDTSRLITARLKIPTHKALRIRVAEADTSIQQWVEALIERELGIAPQSDQTPGV